MELWSARALTNAAWRPSMRVSRAGSLRSVIRATVDSGVSLPPGKWMFSLASSLRLCRRS